MLFGAPYLSVNCSRSQGNMKPDWKHVPIEQASGFVFLLLHKNTEPPTSNKLNQYKFSDLVIIMLILEAKVSVFCTLPLKSVQVLKNQYNYM